MRRYGQFVPADRGVHDRPRRTQYRKCYGFGGKQHQKVLSTSLPYQAQQSIEFNGHNIAHGSSNAGNDTYAIVPGGRRPSEQVDGHSRSIVKCLLSGDTEAAERWLDIMARDCKGTSNKAFYHSLIQACAKAGNPNAAGWCAVRMLRVGLQPNEITFNSVIDACAKVGDVELAGNWWEQMTQIGLEPNGITYNTMINTCAQARDANRAEWWMQRMLHDKVQPCTVSFSTVIDAFAKIGKVEKAEAWFAQMNEAGIVADAVIYNSLINACAKGGNPSKAEYWLLQMHLNKLSPDAKTYNSLINACAKAGITDRAEHWFRRMDQAGCKMDNITFGSVIHASAKVGNVARAEYWMDEMIRRGVVPNLVCFNTVLHACAHSGDHVRARKWLQKILNAGLVPNKITYNSMIDAHGKAGDVASAELWLQQMVAKGFHPDQITYVTLLRACSHGANDRDSDDVARWTFGAIIKAFAHMGIMHGMEHWTGEMVRKGFKPQRALAEEVHYICSSRGKKDFGDRAYAMMQSHWEMPANLKSHNNQRPLRAQESRGGPRPPRFQGQTAGKAQSGAMPGPTLQILTPGLQQAQLRQAPLPQAPLVSSMPSEALAPLQKGLPKADTLSSADHASNVDGTNDGISSVGISGALESSVTAEQLALADQRGLKVPALLELGAMTKMAQQNDLEEDSQMQVDEKEHEVMEFVDGDDVVIPEAVGNASDLPPGRPCRTQNDSSQQRWQRSFDCSRARRVCSRTGSNLSQYCSFPDYLQRFFGY